MNLLVASMLMAALLMPFVQFNNPGSDNGNQAAADSRTENRAEEKAQTIFTDIKISRANGSYLVAVKARPRTGSFYYTVEDGHNQLIPETKVTVSGSYPDWSPVELKLEIPANQLPKNATLILNLYEKDEGGSLTGEPLAIVLQQFK